MAQIGGEVTAKRAKRSSGAGPDAGDGEDRLSALPDDVLVLILLRLSTPAAARTSILARRWRRVWALLPELSFLFGPDGDRIRAVLDGPGPALRRVSVIAEDAAPDALAAWLPAAGRRLSGKLLYQNMAPENSEQDGGAVPLPCFGNATAIDLDLGFLGLSLPSSGAFTRLTELRLSHVRFRGLGELGDAVSSPRCPNLRKLSVRRASGVESLALHSESLSQIFLRYLDGLQRLTIDAPALKELKLFDCFAHNQPVADVSAPQLVSLDWSDCYNPSSVHLGNLGQLQELSTRFIVVFGQPGSICNRDFLMLIKQFQVIHSLNIPIAYHQDISNLQYLMEDITMLPRVMSLTLLVINQGHSFGASAFHVLRMCTGLRRLCLVLCSSSNLQAQPTCPAGCICDQPMNWKTEELLLNCLEEVVITDLKGAEHEVAFVKQLFNWATVLKKMRIVFNYSVSKSKAKELRQTMLSFSRPETFLELYKYSNSGRGSMYLLAPENQGSRL